MTRLPSLVSGLLFGALLWAAVAPLAVGQQTRTLTIRDGTLSVDGQQLSSSQLPSDLDLEGLTAQYQFVGIQRPVIELNGRLYAITDGQNRLRPVSEKEVNGQESSVILQEISARPQSPGAQASKTTTSQRRYLDEVEQANRELYDRLVRERTMEQQAQNLAHVIRMLPANSDKRAAKVDTLRSLLNNIFDLKQENRRREIERLQREIKKVQNSLQKRRQMRDRMIDRRLNHLLGSSPAP